MSAFNFSKNKNSAKGNFGGGGGKGFLLPPIAGASSGNSSNSGSNTGSKRNSKSLTPPNLEGVGGLPLAGKRLVREITHSFISNNY